MSTFRKKITLFFPTPFPYFRPWSGVPLSLLAISRVLDKEGYDIKIVSRFFSDNPEKEVLKHVEESICLGISAMTGFQIYDGLKISRLVKKAYPKIPIVWGGEIIKGIRDKHLKEKFILLELCKNCQYNYHYKSPWWVSK